MAETKPDIDWKARAKELERRLLSVMVVHEEMLREKRELEVRLMANRARDSRLYELRLNEETRELRTQLKGLQYENETLRSIIRQQAPST